MKAWTKSLLISDSGGRRTNGSFKNSGLAFNPTERLKAQVSGNACKTVGSFSRTLTGESESIYLK